MATTKIWDVRAHVGKLIAYVTNRDKTTIAAEIGGNGKEMRLVAEMLGLPPEHFATEERKFVTGINCTPENAEEIMLSLLSGTGGDDIQAYHAYQSFKPGEVDADTAHAIGVQLASELWGEDFPVVVATHIDRGHVHNHFCLSASGFSGKRYHDCKATYKRMRDTSDRLCEEYGLSVIRKPRQRGAKHIAEVHAEKNGIPTIRQQIRVDIDAVAKQEFLPKGFYDRMRALGYTFARRRSFLRIKPYGYDKFFRLEKLGAIPKVIPKDPEAYAAIQSDVRRARRYSEQANFLGKYGIETKDDLIQHALKVREQMNELCKERQKLRNKLRRMKEPTEMQAIRDKIFAISDKLKPLRREFAMCKDIYDRSDDIAKTVERVEFSELVQRAKAEKAKNGRSDR